MDKYIKINEGEVLCDAGYSIKISHNRLTYSEGGKALSIDVEHCISPYVLVVYKDTIKEWYPPFAAEQLQKDQKKEIVQRITNALKFIKTNFIVE